MRKASRDAEAAVAAFEAALQEFEAGSIGQSRRVVAREGLANVLLQDGPSERALELLEAVAEAHAARRGEDRPRTEEARARVDALRAELE